MLATVIQHPATVLVFSVFFILFGIFCFIRVIYIKIRRILRKLVRLARLKARLRRLVWLAFGTANAGVLMSLLHAKIGSANVGGLHNIKTLFLN